MYVRPSHTANGGISRDSCLWSAEQEQGKCLFFFLSPVEPENSVSRDRSGPPIPRQPAHCPHPGRGYDDSVPGEVTKITPSGDRTT